MFFFPARSVQLVILAVSTVKPFFFYAFSFMPDFGILGLYFKSVIPENFSPFMVPPETYTSYKTPLALTYLLVTGLFYCLMPPTELNQQSRQKGIWVSAFLGTNIANKTHLQKFHGPVFYTYV